MRTERAVEVAVGLLVGLLVVSLLASQLLGQPVLLGFVETGSMSPTLEPGDGFVAIPSAIAGPIGPGDVVTYRAEVVGGGGLTTHRIVGETERGFLTRGDANVVTDQDSGEPPVQRAQIVAEVLQVGGHVVAIPGLGLLPTGVQSLLGSVQRTLAGLLGTSALLGTQGLAYLIFAVGVLAYVASVLAERRDEGEGRRRIRTKRSRDDGAIDAGLVVLGLTLLLVATVTASMVASGGTQSFGMISADTNSERPYVLERGTSETFTYIVPSNGRIPVVVFLEPGSDRIAVNRSEVFVPGGSSANVSVTLTAPPRTGHYPQYLTERRYLAVLPRGMIRTLYAIHPWLPLIAIDALVGIGFAGIGWALLGTGRIRVRTRTADLGLWERLDRLLR